MKIEKKHYPYIAGVLALLLFIRWKTKGYIIRPKKKITGDDTDSFDGATKYDKGEVDYRANGISIFNINWEDKTCDFLAMADNESVQGKFEWKQTTELRDSNMGGMAKFGTGWEFSYQKQNSKGADIATFTLVNPKKKASYNKVVDFTNRRIG